LIRIYFHTGFGFIRKVEGKEDWEVSSISYVQPQYNDEIFPNSSIILKKRLSEIPEYYK